jgi:hypothetical protein
MAEGNCLPDLASAAKAQSVRMAESEFAETISTTEDHRLGTGVYAD